MSEKRRRPGNPEFGTKYKADFVSDEPLDVVLPIRVSKSLKARLDKAVDDKGKFCREVIKKALDELEASC